MKNRQPRPMLPLRMLSIGCLLAAALPAAGAELVVSPHPVVNELVTRGFPLGEEGYAQVTPPLVNSTMSGEEQRAAMAELLGSRKLDRYLANKIVAPNKTIIETSEKLPDRSVRRLDLYFVVYGDIETIRERGLMKGVFGPGKKQQADDDEEPLPGIKKYGERREDLSPGEQIDGKPYVFRYRFPILERVVIAGLLSGQSHAAEGLLIDSALTPEELLDEEADPSVWQSIPKGAVNDADLGAPEPFPGFAAYLQATELKFQPGAILVECHAVLVEPKGWFGGRNLLASKLPIVMQQNVRKFRGKLRKAMMEAETEAEDE